MKLKELFTPDSPVVFDWVNFIQDELATHYSAYQLQIATNIPPESTDAKCEASPTEAGIGDSAVESKQHPCQIFLRSTSQFDDMEKFDLFESHKEFLQGKHECGICFQLVSGEDFCEPCHTCSQLFCRQCVTEYCQVELLMREGSMTMGKGFRGGSFSLQGYIYSLILRLIFPALCLLQAT